MATFNSKLLVITRGYHLNQRFLTDFRWLKAWCLGHLNAVAPMGLHPGYPGNMPFVISPRDVNHQPWSI